DARELVVREPPAAAARGFMPGGGDLAPAAQVRDHAGAAAFEQEFADGGVIGGRHRYSEAAVAIEMDRRVARLAGRSYLHIRDARSVRRHGFVPGSDEPGRVESLRRALAQLRRGVRLDAVER